MSEPDAVRSPCISVCALDEADVCVGCWRTGDEISRWGCMTNEERKSVLRKVEEREEPHLL